jgi:hypothetical protein
LDAKKKEFEEIRLKFVHDIEDKKLKITQLNVEKRENQLHVNKISCYNLSFIGYEIGG